MSDGSSPSVSNPTGRGLYSACGRVGAGVAGVEVVCNAW